MSLQPPIRIAPGEMLTLTISPPPCKHMNGWYDTVTFSIFTKRVFVCIDCERVLNHWDAGSAINEVR